MWLSVVEIECGNIKDLLSSSSNSTSPTQQQDKDLGINIADAVKVPPVNCIMLLQSMRSMLAGQTAPLSVQHLVTLVSAG